MRRGFFKAIKRSHGRFDTFRRNNTRQGIHHRRLICEQLEPRLLLTSWPPGNDGWLDFETWHQGSPYNEFVPLDPTTGSRSAVGCVATAIAQTLECWDFPETISFSDSVDSYTTHLGVNIDDDYATYDFPSFSTLNSLLDEISYPLTEADQALLSFAAGIKVDMEYSSSGSGAWFSDKTFEELGFGSADTSDSWDASTQAAVIDNLKSGLPVPIGVYGTRDWDGKPLGHAVVLEGYRTDNGGEFLINLGWVDHDDEWHSLPNFQTDSNTHDSVTWGTVVLVVYNIQPDPSWSQTLADAENTSRSPYGAPTSTRVRWEVSEPGWGKFDSVTVAAGGDLHASYSANGDSGRESSLWIIDEQGTKVREISFGSVNEGIGSTVQDKKGYVYVPTTDGRIYKINPRTGSASQIFVVPDSNPNHHQLDWLKIDEINGNERIFTASPKTVYCLTRTGSLIWQKTLPINSSLPYPNGYDTRCVAIDNIRGKVYVPYHDYKTPHLAVLDTANGTILHNEVFPDESIMMARIGVPSIGSDGTIYVGSFTTLYALNPDSTLTQKWPPVNKYPGFMAHWNQAPTIGRDGTIYVSYMKPNYTDYAVAALDPDTGIARWEILFQLDAIGGDNIGAICAAANDIITFSVNYENGSANDTHRIYAYRDLGGSNYEKVWDKYVGVNGGRIALGPGDTLYSIPTSFETTTTITALGSGQLGMGFIDNQAPFDASDPGIPPGTVIEGASANLSWTDSDPDGHDLTYTVLLGTADTQTGLMRPVAMDLTNPSYACDDLDPGETYFWKIISTDGQATTEGPTWTFSVAAAPEVIDRYIFYNNSSFDGNDPAANGDDDGAIAPDPDDCVDPAHGKTALLPGGTATFQNYTTYSRGINGIMVDIAALADADNLNVNDDFVFKYGNDDTPDDWTDAPDPTIDVRPSEGVGTSDRVTLIWGDNTIPTRNWLQVTVLATANTGLAVDDVFYFGNAIGDADGDRVAAYADMYTIHQEIPRAAPICDLLDIDRDGAVAYADMYQTHLEIGQTPGLNLITVPAPPLGSGVVATTIPGSTESNVFDARNTVAKSNNRSQGRQSRIVAPLDHASTATVMMLGYQKTAGAVDKALAHDAVLEEPIGGDTDGSTISLGKIAWLYDLDQISAGSQRFKKDKNDSAEKAVDVLLATFWP